MDAGSNSRHETCKEFTVMNKLPFFKELSDEALRTEYRAYRELAYNGMNMAAAGCCNNRRVAANVGRSMRAIGIIEGLARQRKIRLA
jgi:hypothetical protein